MSDWKEVKDMELTVQPLLKLSSDQHITLIIHVIFIINSFQPFFSCGGISILASCSVSAQTPLSLQVCPEEKAQILELSALSYQVHPTQHLSVLTTLEKLT